MGWVDLYLAHVEDNWLILKMGRIRVGSQLINVPCQPDLIHLPPLIQTHADGFFFFLIKSLNLTTTTLHIYNR